MLAGPDAVAEIADAILPALRPGTVWAEMSTIGPDAVRALAARLPDGVTLVDAPVVGSTDKAEAGELGILAGPGVFYGDFFPQHVRLSLTASDERVAAAAARLRASV